MSRRLCKLIIWVFLATLLAATYGVVNDQITVTLSPEYFSVFKRQQFAEALMTCGLWKAPTRVQAILVGILATWWFGLFLGIILSAVGTAGKRPPLPTHDFLRAIGGIMVFTLGASIIFGTLAYAVEPIVKPDASQWPFLEGIRQVRAAFAVGWWHNGAYLGGLLGTVLDCLTVRRRRQAIAQRDV